MSEKIGINQAIEKLEKIMSILDRLMVPDDRFLATACALKLLTRETLNDLKSIEKVSGKEVEANLLGHPHEIADKVNNRIWGKG